MAVSDEYVSIPTGSITVDPAQIHSTVQVGFNSNWFDYSLTINAAHISCVEVSIPTGSITVCVFEPSS